MNPTREEFAVMEQKMKLLIDDLVDRLADIMKRKAPLESAGVKIGLVVGKACQVGWEARDEAQKRVS